MLTFANVKRIVIPEGNVIAIDDENNVRIWQAAYDAIVNGVSPLLLPSAVQQAIVYLKQKGVCEQNGTPLPNSPLDIKCNNGILKVKDKELPLEYKRILGINYNNNAYYEITNFKMRGSDTIRFSFKCTMQSPACNVLGAYEGSASAQTNYSLYLGATNSAKYLRYNGGTYVSKASQNQQYDVVITPTGSDGFEIDSTWTEKTFESVNNLCVGTTSSTASSSKMVGQIIGNIVVDGRLNLIPCERISDNVIGYYDTYTNIFYEPIGSNPTSMGYDITKGKVYVDGIREILNVAQQNASAEDLLQVGDYKDEQDIISGNIIRNIGVKILNGTEMEDGFSFGNHKIVIYLPGNPGEEISRTPLCTHLRGVSETSANLPNNCITAHSHMSNNYYVIILRNDNWSTAEDYKAWVESQYQAGTPVIVLYPLLNETTEQVAGQSLYTIPGDNTITITAEVDNIPLEIKYKRH